MMKSVMPFEITISYNGFTNTRTVYLDGDKVADRGILKALFLTRLFWIKEKIGVDLT